MSYVREIEADLDWREAELAALRIMIINRDLSHRDKLVLFRAAWSLLYAHYEGFCKFALSVYYDQLSRLGVTCKNFPTPIRNFALLAAVKAIKHKPTEEAINDILEFDSLHLNRPPNFPEVNTESNLWPSVLEGLLAAAELNVLQVDANKFRLKTLVSRRNKIAHGERDMIMDFDYYEEYETAFREVAYNLAIEIENKIESLARLTSSN